MPKVSVIVPNYNHSEYLHQRLDSIFIQTYQDFEVILLDDCSTDNSVDILSEYAKNRKVSHFIANKKNSGSTFRQWIKGIELAKGELIWIAESDDVAEEFFLELAVQKLQNSKCTLYFTNSLIIDEKGNIQDRWNENMPIYKLDFIKNGRELIQEYMTIANIIPNASAVVFRNGVISDNIKESIITYKINGDWYLWINLLLNGDCSFSSEPYNYFRRHNEAGSPKNVANFKNIEEAFRINIFLKNTGIKINGKRWLRTWIIQASYNFPNLIKSNFVNIYKLSFSIFPLPLCYLLYVIILHKFSTFRRN